MVDLSVVIPTYNRAAFLGEALRSIARQTVQPTEVIVVDDASTDDTEFCVRSSASPVLYHRLPQRSGAAVARNEGVEVARGEVVIFLDSDDLLEPTHHARVLEILKEQPEIALFSCDALLIDEAGSSLRGGQTYWQIQCAIKRITLRSGRRNLRDMFLLSTLFAGCAVRRDVFRRVGGLRQELFPLEDYDLMLRVAAEGYPLYYEHAPLARYRMHSDNSSGSQQAVLVQEQRLRCLLSVLSRSMELRQWGRRAQARIGEVRRELALAQLKARQPRAGMVQLLRSLREDPSGLIELGRVALRWLGRRSLFAPLV